MIPYTELNQRALGNLREYLVHEIRTAVAERAPLVKKWKRWHEMYATKPEHEVKTFPFVGASNLVMPVIATDVELFWSRLMGILFEQERLWAGRALRPDWEALKPRIEEFLYWAQKFELNIEGPISNFVLEMCKLGTGVLKTRYERRMKEVFEYRESPQGIYQAERLIQLKDGPKVEWVPLEDFLLKSTAVDKESSPWKAHRIWLTWAQLVERINAGLYVDPALVGNSGIPGSMTLERLRSWWANKKGGEVQQLRQQLNSVVPGQGDLFELWEVWLDWDIKATGRPRALVCVLHLESESYLRVDWNPWFNQEDPFDVAVFMPQEGSPLGIGICQMLDGAQDEVTALHNQRVDNGTLGNSIVLGAVANGKIKQNEPIYPGRIFLVNNPNDIWPIQFGRANQNTILDEQNTLSFHRARTGTNDILLGQGGPDIGYAKAATNMMLYQESYKKFDRILSSVRKALGSVGMKVLELYQQFNQNGKPYLALGDADGAAVTQVLQFPTDLLRFGFNIEVTATKADLSREMQIRTDTMLLQMQQQQAQQIVQLLMLALNPQVPPVVQQVLMRSVMTSNLLLARIYEAHGIQDLEAYLPLGVASNGASQSSFGPPADAASGLLNAPGVPFAVGGIPAGVAPLQNGYAGGVQQPLGLGAASGMGGGMQSYPGTPPSPI